MNELAESIIEEAFENFLLATGCPAYHPRMVWLVQGYESSYRTVNRFLIHPEVKELLRQCFVRFHCNLAEEKQIEKEAIFIDGRNLRRPRTITPSYGKKPVERYSRGLVERSNRIYKELFEKEIILEIEREGSDELSEQVLSTSLKI